MRCALKSWCPEQGSLRGAGVRRWPARQEPHPVPRLASCSASPGPGAFPGRGLAGPGSGRAAVTPRWAAECRHAHPGSALRLRGCSGFPVPIFWDTVRHCKGAKLCHSLHEKYADSDEIISTPMQLPASVSPSVVSCLWHSRGNQCSFSPVSPPTQGFLSPGMEGLQLFCSSWLLCTLSKMSFFYSCFKG